MHTINDNHGEYHLVHLLQPKEDYMQMSKHFAGRSCRCNQNGCRVCQTTHRRDSRRGFALSKRHGVNKKVLLKGSMSIRFVDLG